MIKKTIAGLVLSSMALFALPNNEIELVMMSKALQKKAVVLATMDLQGNTKQKFGKLYDEYQEKLMEQRLAELSLIKDYAQNYDNLTDKNADKLIKKWVTDEEAKMVLTKEYMAKFKKIMPSSDVIRYFQIERRMQILRDAQISSVIPLAQPAAPAIVK
jgi:hypothetical protein